MSRSLLTLTVNIVFGILLFSSQSLACTCMAKPTVLDAFERSSLVVTAHLASVDKIREKQGEYDIRYISSVTMVVDKVYKGDIKSGTALKFAQGGGADCIWTYDEKWIGEKFLFYLRQPTMGPSFGDGMGSASVFPREGKAAMVPMYYPSGCGRSSGLESAVDDLAYLDSATNVKGKTRLSGTFGTWFNRGFNPENIKVKIVGKTKSFVAKTNKDGFFEVYDLPEGDYVVEPEIPFGWKINDYMLERTSSGYEEFDPAGKRQGPNRIPVRIAHGRHTALDLIFDIDTAVKGRVLSPAGNPMKDVCVMAVSTELAEGDHRGHLDCTNEKGEFTIDEMAPGNYRLVANHKGLLDADTPFGAVFYPGVTGRDNAGIVAVEPGKYVTGRDIKISQTVELVTIKGNFLFSDGKPVADARVKFAPDDKKRFDDMSQRTDAAGGFVFRLPKGALGKVSGDMYTYNGMFKECPKLEAIIKESGNHTYTAKSTVAKVNSLKPQAISITFPFPYCERSKD